MSGTVAITEDPSRVNERDAPIRFDADKARQLAAQSGMPLLQAAREVKRETLLSLITYGDGTELRRVLAHLVREIYK